MRTEEGFRRTVSHFHLVPLLQTVHQHNAYAWLAIEGKATISFQISPRSSLLRSHRMLGLDSIKAIKLMMRVELEQTVSQSCRQQSKISERAAELVHSVLQQDDPFVKERDLNGMIAYIRLAVEALRQGLFGDSVPIRFSTRHGEPLILWETKSPSAGEKHMQAMLSSQSTKESSSLTLMGSLLIKGSISTGFFALFIELASFMKILSLEMSSNEASL
ncbi:hypothetical protein PIIN_05231 [Serendipita indica DSM 11827]|uniref:Uncharacterized protein n=1 Tax=Serendipita indica (strain DSM 11827) TaxID=1109443 RepID=G4TIY5_SERID|nr:hypothetical protein PIIN_05231 [Serendipita indica DSM 11827]